MKSIYMLDTDTASYLIRGQSTALDTRIEATAPEQICISAVTRGELLYGLRIKQGAHRLEKIVDQFLARVRSLAWGDGAATHFAAVASAMHIAGTPIGTMDAMIAGHALAEGAILVTNNVRHFSRVAGLDIENWSAQG